MPQVSARDIVRTASDRQLKELAKSGIEAKGRLARYREKAQEGMGYMVSSMEAGGSAFAFGFLRGRYAKDGELRFMGIPIDLASGLALKGLAFAEQFGQYDSDGHALGQGAIDCYLSTLGVRFGMEARMKAEGGDVASGFSPDDVAAEMAASMGAY